MARARLTRARVALTVAGAAVALLALGASTVAEAATPAPNPSWQQVPSGPLGSQLPGATAFGDTPGDTAEQVTFVLKARQLQQLQSEVLRGPRRFLTVPQFAASYGQSPQAVGAITSYLARFGIRSTVLPNRLGITTRGTAAQYDRALNTAQKQYRIPVRPGRPGWPGWNGRNGRNGFHPRGPQNVHAPSRAPQLPPQLAQYVTTIFGLSNYSPYVSNAVTSTSLLTPAVDAQKQQQLEALAARPGDLVIPPEDCEAILGLPRICNVPSSFSSQYGLSPLSARYDGSGQTVGVVTLAPLEQGAAEDYWLNMSDTPQTSRTVTVRNVDGGPAPDDDPTETDLDVEMAGGVAPGANVVVYQAPNSDAGAIDAFFQAATENVADSVSFSWAESETLVAYGQASGTGPSAWQTAFDQVFLELAIQGQSVFVSSGDTGAYDAVLDDPINSTNLSVSAFAASPYVTGAGGTTLPYTGTFFGEWLDTATVTVPQERAWGYDYLWKAGAAIHRIGYADSAKQLIGGGGGGYSTAQPMPAYQRAIPGASGFTAVRNLTPSGFQQLAPRLSLPTDWAVNPSPQLARGHATGRAVPDLAADADLYTGYLVNVPFQFGLIPVGGTSVVAPQLAGAAAVINQSNRGRAGFWNPAMYRAASSHSSPFTPLNQPGPGNDNLYYSGTPGTLYNPATGLGTPNLAKLAPFLRR